MRDNFLDMFEDGRKFDMVTKNGAEWKQFARRQGGTKEGAFSSQSEEDKVPSFEDAMFIDMIRSMKKDKI